MNVSKLALLSLSIISPICAMQISNELLMASHNLGKIKLYRDSYGFTLKQNKELHSIANHDVDPLLRKANPEQLKEFLKAGYIKVKQANNGEFSLSAHTRGLGGGPITAGIFYWGTKGICYGTAAVTAFFTVKNAVVERSPAAAVNIANVAIVTTIAGGAKATVAMVEGVSTVAASIGMVLPLP